MVDTVQRPIAAENLDMEWSDPPPENRGLPIKRGRFDGHKTQLRTRPGQWMTVYKTYGTDTSPRTGKDRSPGSRASAAASSFKPADGFESRSYRVTPEDVESGLHRQDELGNHVVKARYTG